MTRVGLVGAGRAGKAHLAALWRTPGVHIVAVCDTDSDALQRTRRHFPSTVTTATIEETIEECALDCIHIATPPYLHFAMIATALRAGIRVLVEKPLGVSLDECTRIRGMREAVGRLVICFQERFRPSVLAAKRWMPMLGEIVHARLEQRFQRSEGRDDPRSWKTDKSKQGGGIVIDRVIHALDLGLWLMATPVTAAGARTRASSIGVEDHVSGHFEFVNGARWVFSASCEDGGPYGLSFEIVGTAGRLLLDHESASIELAGGRRLSMIDAPRLIQAPWGPTRWGADHRDLFEAVYVRGTDHEYAVPMLPDALRAQALVDAVYRSASQEGQLVDLYVGLGRHG